MNEKKSGWPLEDDEVEQVSGGMRPIAGQESDKICPNCNNSDTAAVINTARWVCPKCGCIYGPNGYIIGFEETIVNSK